MAYWMKSFAGVTIPIYSPRVPIGTGESKLALLDIPGGGVFDALGADQAPVGRETIPVDCEIVAATPAAFRTTLDIWRALRGKRGQLVRADDAGNQHWIYARLNQILGDRTHRNISSAPITLLFERISPIWNGTAHDDDWGLTSNPATAQIDNDGNAIVEDVIITITAAGSNITNLVIKKKVGATAYGHLVYAGTIAVGQSLVIDCGAKSVLNNGSDDYANFSLGSEHKNDAWIRLGTGTNDIEITRTGGSVSCNANFVFYDGWE